MLYDNFFSSNYLKSPNMEHEQTKIGKDFEEFWDLFIEAVDHVHIAKKYAKNGACYAKTIKVATVW